MRRLGKGIIAVLAAAVLTAGGTATAAEGRGREAPDPVTSDFDGDGRADLVIGTPFDDGDGVEDAGSVTVLYGSERGLTALRSRRFSQATPGIADDAEPGDFFGWATAAGDFDGDGYGDLAIGVLGEDLGARKQDAGAVHVLYGSPEGLTHRRGQIWTGDSPLFPGFAEGAEAFGAVLSVGDMNDDIRADLAVGARSKEVGDDEAAGAVFVLPGAQGGLTADGVRMWTQDSPGMLDEAEPSDMFGTGVAFGDLDGDGFDDLAVGVIGEDIGVPGQGVGDAGAVAVLYGGAGGLSAARDQLWTQDSPGVPGESETPDLMGASLAVGDFDGDGFGDLAADSFGESVGGNDLAGGITVLYGSRSGLTAEGAREITQATQGVPDTAQRNDQFGNPLAVGDFDGDGRDELVAGVPNESVDGVFRAGATYVMPGSDEGLTADGGLLWTQDSPDVPDRAEPGDSFGAALAVGNFGRGPHADLALTARAESIDGAREAGAVSVIYAGTGLGDNGSQLWTRNSAGVPGLAADRDWFGFSLGGA